MIPEASPEASAEGNIPTKGEQHACYMAEHLTIIGLLYHYHMDNIYTCNITAHVKGEMYNVVRPIYHGIYRLFYTKYAVAT